ncbi:hypothetical protein CDAR_486071 [Caerostris darwini]|uniref:Uncharacterized protein n=1 Tax=Caerostris darwini TaxID=1538125 RepID=A0AAV4WJ85_9ARAC|nr:hypothetical protein CDAR_486071 [Caerostris darwini]
MQISRQLKYTVFSICLTESRQNKQLVTQNNLDLPFHDFVNYLERTDFQYLESSQQKNDDKGNDISCSKDPLSEPANPVDTCPSNFVYLGPISNYSCPLRLWVSIFHHQLCSNLQYRLIVIFLTKVI